jgi:hypothetical protein
LIQAHRGRGWLGAGNPGGKIADRCNLQRTIPFLNYAWVSLGHTKVWRSNSMRPFSLGRCDGRFGIRARHRLRDKPMFHRHDRSICGSRIGSEVAARQSSLRPGFFMPRTESSAAPPYDLSRGGALQGAARFRKGLQMMTSTLPLHGGLVDIVRQMPMTPDRRRRLDTYEPVRDGDCWCPKCHIEGVTKPSILKSVDDDDPAKTRRYDCAVCRQQYRVGT